MTVKQITAPFTTAALPSRKVLVAFLFFIIVGGGASVAIRITYQEIASFWSATARFGLGALVFWAITAVKRIPLPKGKSLVGAVLYGFLGVGLGFVLIAWGLVETPASLYQILMAMVPLSTILVAAIIARERISLNFVLGAAFVLAGVLVGALLPEKKKA